MAQSAPFTSDSSNGPIGPSSSTSLPSSFTSQFAAAVSSSIQLDEPRLLPLVLSYSNSFETEMSAFLCSSVLPSSAPLQVIPPEERWSTSVRWHWLTFKEYFPAHRDDNYMASKATAYTLHEGRWEEKPDALTDVYTALSAIQSWLERMAVDKSKKTYECEPATLWRAGLSAASEGARAAQTPSSVETSSSSSTFDCFHSLLHDHRAQVRHEQPDMRFGEVARELAQRWMNSTADVRTTYQARAAEDSQRYEVEMEAYKSAHWKVEAHKKKEKKWTRNTDSNSGEDEEDEEDEGEDDNS